MTIRPLVALAAIVVGTATCSSTAFGQQGETVYAKVAASVFVLRVADDAGKEIATATGFVVDADVLLTNAHVLNAGHVSIQVGPISLPCDVQRVDHGQPRFVQHSMNRLGILQKGGNKKYWGVHLVSSGSS